MSELYDQFLDVAQEIQNYIRQAKINLQKGSSGISSARSFTSQARQTYVNASTFISKLKGQENSLSQSALKKLNNELTDLEAVVNVQTVQTPQYGQNKNLVEANMYLKDTENMMDEANTTAGDLVNVIGQQNSQMKAVGGKTHNIVSNTAEANKLVAHMTRVEKMVNLILWGISGGMVLIDCIGFYVFHHTVK